ncbi:MAG TPA: hypothetical protein PLO24_13505 [Bacteroidales bacterium]|nr:hypothetical protein [Bacteroidales bacterium]HOS72420.1 hypothetical protein [Bacteroidales bacterium]HQH23997.1 hypothetical protein [Bacteroidales bacterium]HQJ83378.1 hypothetical protein [Bacteroidales bacterium]
MAVLLFSSCTKENDMANVQVKFRTVQSSAKIARGEMSSLPETEYTSGSSLSGTGYPSGASFVPDKFLINIKEIEFEFEKPYPGFTGPHNCECEKDGECEIEFEGPFLIDIASSEAMTGLLLGRFPLPSAVYEEIELDIAPSRNRNNKQINGRSVFISGTYQGKPIELWTNSKAELEIEFPGKRAVDLTQPNADMWIRIHLDRIIANLSAMDFSSAVDGNGNGIIEIGHDDQDGNNALSATLFNSFRGSFELDD